jgi:hypothetical protein
VTRYALAWILALVVAAVAFLYAWNDFKTDKRAEGTNGHRNVDFGGQYLIGRMLQQGYGRELYFRDQQRSVLEIAYTRDDEDQPLAESDADDLVNNTVDADTSVTGRGPVERWILTKAGEDPAINPPKIGGPLYPPINAFFYYPLACMKPLYAYRINQVANLVFAFSAGLGVSLLSRGRVWMPIAATFVFIFPGFSGSICLGQNATWTMNLVLWGWVLISRDRPVAGGLVWVLLAFKPVWLLSFLLVPILTQRWRVALAMIGAAVALGLATLPFVGLHSWFDWIHIGRAANASYDIDKNWIWISRDLYSIARRWMLDFNADEWGPERVPYPVWTNVLSIAPLVLVLLTLVAGAFLRRARISQAIDGPAAAFVLLGAWLMCYHFMYYDVLLAYLPVALLFTHPRRYLNPLFIGLRPFRRPKPSAELLDFYRPIRNFHPRNWLPYLQGYGQLLMMNSLVMSFVALLISIQYVFPYFGVRLYDCVPWDTFVLIGLWLWCGFCVFSEWGDVASTAERQQHPEPAGRIGARESPHLPGVEEPTADRQELRRTSL